MNKSAPSTEVVFVCVDDTDDLTKETSTGSICEKIAHCLSQRFGSSINMGITRHQLLLGEQVPYTSHNSSMCFDMKLPAGQEEFVRSIGWDIIESNRAVTSNPGFCVFASEATDENTCQELAHFGARAKQEYVPLEDARLLAERTPGLTLMGGGATEQGIVGALAGIGLRLSGNDGRFRGEWDLETLVPISERAEKAWASAETCRRAFAQRGTQASLVDDAGHEIDGSDNIMLTSGVKPILRSGRFTIVCVKNDDGSWMPSTRKSFASKSGTGRRKCNEFECDPDPEEHLHSERLGLCASCLYRIVMPKGIECARECVFS